MQAKLPIWVGGGGEKRTLRIAARYADGWNVPFVDPPTFAAKRDVLHRHCADVGRDPAEIRCAVNVGLAWTDESLHQQFGNLAERVRPGVLGGSVDEVVDRIGEYVDAGADQVNLALRAPVRRRRPRAVQRGDVPPDLSRHLGSPGSAELGSGDDRAKIVRVHRHGIGRQPRSLRFWASNSSGDSEPRCIMPSSFSSWVAASVGVARGGGRRTSGPR